MTEGKTLLQLLAAELTEWPYGAGHAVCGIVGEYTRQVVHFSQGGRPVKDPRDGGWTNNPEFCADDSATWSSASHVLLTEAPTDWQTAIVSRQQWEAERQTLNSHYHVIKIGGEGAHTQILSSPGRFISDQFDDTKRWHEAEPPGIESVAGVTRAQPLFRAEFRIEVLVSADEWIQQNSDTPGARIMEGLMGRIKTEMGWSEYFHNRADHAGRRVNELRDAIRNLCSDQGNADLFLSGEIDIDELAAKERWNV